MDETTYLNDVWTVYFHCADDADWTLSSYVRLTDISTVEEFWATHTCIHDKLPENMFFIMREGIYPCWDDPKNLYGGAVSIKVAKHDVPRAWEALCSRVLGETLLGRGSSSDDLVNGISISPKRYFCIIKVWFKDLSQCRAEDLMIPSWYSGEVLLRSHLDCIHANTIKLTERSASQQVGKCTTTQ